MDRNVGGKIIHNARYIASGFVPPSEDPLAFAADTWDSLDDKTREEYEAAAQALYDKIFQEFEGYVIHFVDGKPQRIMTSGELQSATDHLSKHQENSSRRSDSLTLLISNAIYNLKNKESTQLAKLKYFQDNILVYLRAIALVADGCSGEGITHRQKDERFKLLISSIESAIQKVSDGYDSLLTNYWYQKPDLFRSDYPVIRYLEKIKDLENQVAKLKGEEVNECPFGSDGF